MKAIEKSTAANLLWIVPYHLPGDWKLDAKGVSHTAEALKEAGVGQVAMIAPGDSVAARGILQTEDYRNVSRALCETSQIFRSYDIEAGVWLAPTLRAGINPFPSDDPRHANYAFERITDLRGHKSDASYCPLDRRFQDYLGSVLSTIASDLKPPFILFEDDYELSNHRRDIRFGCFCPLHLERFATMVGEYYSRDELLVRFSQLHVEDNQKLRKMWSELSCNSLAEMAASLRCKVDQVSPETQLGLCETGCSDFDGRMTIPVADAFAGPHLRPLVRGCGSTYSSDDPLELPGNVSHAMYVAQRRDARVQWIHECDTYPHTGYFSSAAKLISLATAAIMYGADGALYYALQYLDCPEEDSRYLETLRQWRPRLESLHQQIHDAELTGVQVYYRRDTKDYLSYCKDNPLPGYVGRNADWAAILGQYGIPYTTLPSSGRVRVVSGDVVLAMSDREIDELLASQVILDGKSAWHLAQRGRSVDIGVNIKPVDKLPAVRERISPPTSWGQAPAFEMYYYNNMPAGGELASCFELEPMEHTQVLAEYLDAQHQPLAASMSLCQNQLGGRVAVLGYDIFNVRSSSIFNHRRSWLIKRLILDLDESSMDVCVEQDPKVFTLVAKIASERRLIMKTTNLSLDSLRRVVVSVSERWRNATVEMMDNQGHWRTVDNVHREPMHQSRTRLTLPVDLPVAQPALWRLSEA